MKDDKGGLSKLVEVVDVGRSGSQRCPQADGHVMGTASVEVQEFEEISIPARSLERIGKGPWRIEWLNIVALVEELWGVVDGTKQTDRVV